MIWIIIAIWLITNLSIAFGIGISIVISDEEKLKKVTDKFKKQPKGLGAVNKPSHAEIIKRGTVQEETERAMEDTLDEIIPNEEKPEEKRNK